MCGKKKSSDLSGSVRSREAEFSLGKLSNLTVHFNIFPRIPDILGNTFGNYLEECEYHWLFYNTEEKQ